MIVELILNQWMKELNEYKKTMEEKPNVIYVTEACNCLRKAYYQRKELPPVHMLPYRMTVLSRLGKKLHEVIEAFLEHNGYGVEVDCSTKLSVDGETIEVRGKADALGDNEVIEIKTTKKLPDAPHYNHLLQINTYMDMLNVKKGRLIYISRDTGEIKEIAVEYDPDLPPILYRRAQQLYSYLKNNVEPPEEKSCWCRECPWRYKCIFKMY